MKSINVSTQLCECGCGQPTKLATKTRADRGFVAGQPMRFLPNHWQRTNKRVPIQDRFWQHVTKGAPDECWPWTGYRTERGYGRTRHGNKSERTHRIAYELTHGPIAEGLEVCHTCDNPPCCNPAHLFLGTHKQNMEDMVSKGRRNGPRGDSHPSRTHPELFPHGMTHHKAKLTDEQVIAIRARYAAGGISFAELGRESGLTPENISYLVHRRTWKHLP